MAGKTGAMTAMQWAGATCATCVRRRSVRVAVAIMSCLTVVTAGAQDVALSGMLGNKPLLVVNGSTPRAVAVGETHMGVKVLGAGADRATVLSGGATIHDPAGRIARSYWRCAVIGRQ